jgi:methyl-accepting chemotaxis protein
VGRWTFGQKIAAGLGVVLLIQALVGWFSYATTGGLLDALKARAHTFDVIDDLEALLSQLKDAETGQRGFLITGRDDYLEPYRAAIAKVHKTYEEARALTTDNPEHQQRLRDVDGLMATKLAELEETIQVRKKDGFEAAVKIVLTDRGRQVMDEIRRAVSAMETEEKRLLAERTELTNARSSQLTWTISAGFGAAVVLSLLVVILLTRTLGRQVGSAVLHIQSSASELQAAANQQSSSTTEQVAAMTEITTTIRELLSTSRQIAESAQRVSRIADDTTAAARGGDQVVQRTQDAFVSIKRQIDQVVAHMLELGKRSQQIGSVLEVVNELLEQTNILAINATIEASGAGENGKRFGAVADEIRKLGDRVGGSAREIRGLVEEVRSSVNTTIMATEGSVKAVESGARQFGEVTTSFKQIVGQVGTATEAAREIELSTKQQATAVEQVNVAVANVAQTSKEAEASTTQTLQTASELAALSRELSRIVQPTASA